jgi:ABC-type branched-subunit amino acid transport system substrate-binding protein
MKRKRLLTITGAICCLGVVGGSASAKLTHSAGGQVVVAHGQVLQIAVAVDDTGLGAFFGPSVRDAVQMAIERHPRVRGFAIQVNAFNAPCGGGSAQSLADNAATATAVVANTQTVAVIGHPCSPEGSAWLPTYETAGLATINGSTTGSFIAPLGPTVFDATTIPDPAFTDTWYPLVKTLPSDLRWRSRFEARFGSPPSDFADLYYDATSVLLKAIAKTARVDHHHSLVIDRGVLAATVRNTRGFAGVTCTVTLDPATGFRVDDPAALARCARQGHTHM